MQLPIESLVDQFAFEGTYAGYTTIKSGHINDTYLIQTQEKDKPDYILQRINHHVFQYVEELQNNIFRVTSHIRSRLEKAGVQNIDLKVLTLIPAKTGKWYIQTPEGDFWRMLMYIPGSQSFEQLSSPDLAFKAGRAFGEFGALLADIEGGPLFETIKDFHNMEWRLQQFRDAVKNNAASRLSVVKDEIRQVEERAEEMCLVQRLSREGKLPKRIVHCDTKISNILFDQKGDILCVIDLDTVMSGHVSSDFGDAIRTGTNTGKEDDRDLNKVSMDIRLFKGFAEGYITGGASFLTPEEIRILPFSAKLFAYMQAVRFLADYINGDTYYKIHYPEHNLDRTRAQLKLLFSMEAVYPEMCDIVDKVAREKCKNYA